MQPADFLRSAGNWRVVAPLRADGSSRSYLRVQHPKGETAILMDAAPDSSALSTPGHRISDFLRLATALRDSGLRAPEIYAAQPDEGLVLMEDFGDITFHDAMNHGVPPENIYELAAQILAHFRLEPPAAELPEYFKSPVHKGRQRLVDWYIPAIKGAQNPDGLVESYLSAWADIERLLPPPLTGFLHIDFHVDNLMWIEDAKGLNRCGILDFQGAMKGPLAYDTANLLGDMRIDVPQSLNDPVLKIVSKGLTPAETHSFHLWRIVLSAQFHARMAGQVFRLALVNGKPQYMSYLPRLLCALRKDLEHPLLRPMSRWMRENDVDLNPSGDINPERIRAFIRPDAF